MHFSVAKALVLAAATSSASAHSLFTTLFVNGVSQGDGRCVRMNLQGDQATWPVENLDSSDMVCGFDGQKGVNRVCHVPDGATLSFEYRSKPFEVNDGSYDAIDPGHVGPCAVYLKKVGSAIDTTGEGDGWFKLFDDGYDESTGKWCNDMINANNNHLSAKLPKGLAGGYYLARPEMLALHAAVSGDPQFYTGCAQIFIDSSGNLVPTDTVSIPGYVSKDDAAVTFNVYQDPMDLPYPKPGPKPANFQEGATGMSVQRQQTQGLSPKSCILAVANWCGNEVPSYNDMEGCWDAVENCWQQDRECWSSLPSIEGDGCRLWEDKCHDISDHCKANKLHGPPNKGKVLTPKQPTINPGRLLPTSPGGKIIAGSVATKKPAGNEGPSSKPTKIATSTLSKETPKTKTSKMPKPSPKTTESPVFVSTVVVTKVTTDVIVKTVTA